MDLTLLLFLKTSILGRGKRPLIECNSRCESETPDLGSRLKIRILFVDWEVDVTHRSSIHHSVYPGLLQECPS